jgi:hypothetical protein
MVKMASHASSQASMGASRVIMSSTGRTVRRPVSIANLASARASGSALAMCQYRVGATSPTAHITYVATIPAATTACRARSARAR